MATVKQLPKELAQWRDKIRESAVREGLDFFEVTFEMVDSYEMNELAALGGFPTRYPHWRFGMEYDKLSKSYSYGLSKIYEMVINTDPCYAYLLTANSLLDQKLVMAHVYGHSDFFKQNKYFEHTNRRMLDVMANNAVRIRRYMETFGQEAVEEFIDRCLSVDNLIDYHAAGIKRRLSPEELAARDKADARPDPQIMKADESARPQTRAYLDKFLKTTATQLEANKAVVGPSPAVPPKQVEIKKNPENPQRDVLLFLLENAPLEEWQVDVLSIIRDEAYYFAPQGQTKIMNEGWASYWHATLMTKHGLMTDSEVINYADVHSGTMYTPPGGFNPYKIGLELFRDIEERWNRGQFGKEWDECSDVQAKSRWDKKLGQGRQKIFEIRKLYSDVTFIDTFLTEDFCRRNKLFSFAYNQRTGQHEIESREFKKVKDSLLTMLTNFGQPLIEVVDANYQNRGELHLIHRFDGRDLRPDYADLTLRNLQAIWSRPVNIETQVEGKTRMLSFDGKEFKETTLT